MFVGSSKVSYCVTASCIERANCTVVHSEGGVRDGRSAFYLLQTSFGKRKPEVDNSIIIITGMFKNMSLTVV